jgi:tetratricopeptide (TPR) repeat protein
MSDRKSALDDLRSRLTTWAAQDLEAGYILNACDKQTRIWDLLRLEAHFNPTIQVIAGPFLQELEDIEKRVSDNVDAEESWKVLCNICLLRGALCENIEDYEGSVVAIRNAASILDQHEEDYFHAELCVVLTKLLFKGYTASGKEHDGLLDLADTSIDQAISTFQEWEDLDHLRWCASWQAELCLARGRHTGAPKHFEEGLRRVRDGRRLWKEQRHELSTLSGSQGMETKHAFLVGEFITPISDTFSRDLFDIGIDLALALGDLEISWKDRRQGILQKCWA